MEEEKKLAGRTIIKKHSLTCYRGTITAKGKVRYSRLPCIVTEHGSFRLLPGVVSINDLEIGSTYFFQTVEWEFEYSPIEVVDFTKV